MTVLSGPMRRAVFGAIIAAFANSHYLAPALAGGTESCRSASERCGNRGGSRASGSHDGAAAAIGAGVGLLLQGLATAPSNEPSQEELIRDHVDDLKRQRAAPPSAKARAQLKAAEADPALDPWAGKPGTKQKQKGYADAVSCVSFDKRNSLADFLVNNCDVPIVVRWRDSKHCRTGCMESVKAGGRSSVTKMRGATTFSACQGRSCSPSKL